RRGPRSVRRGEDKFAPAFACRVPEAQGSAMRIAIARSVVRPAPRGKRPFEEFHRSLARSSRGIQVGFESHLAASPKMGKGVIHDLCGLESIEAMHRSEEHTSE